MPRLRCASCNVLGAILLTTPFAATVALAADSGSAAASTKGRLAAQFEARLANSLLVLVPDEVIDAKGAASAQNRRLRNVFEEQPAPRNSLVAALLASSRFGAGSGRGDFAATGAAAGNDAHQQRGRRPVSPNGPPDGVPGPPDGVPGPPDGVPGPPDGVPGPPDGVPGPPDGVPGPPDGVPPGPPNGR